MLRALWLEGLVFYQNERDAVAALHVVGGDPDAHRSARREWYLTLTLFIHHVEMLRARLLVCSTEVTRELDEVRRLLRSEDRRVARSGDGRRRLPALEGELRRLVQRTSDFARTCSSASTGTSR